MKVNIATGLKNFIGSKKPSLQHENEAMYLSIQELDNKVNKLRKALEEIEKLDLVMAAFNSTRIAKKVLK